MNNNENLLIQPIPYEGESAASYLLRAAQLNMHSSVYNLFGKAHFKFLVKQAPNCDITDLPRFQYALQLLNINTAYKWLAFEKISLTGRSARMWGNIEINNKLLKSSPQSYCPLCLEEQPFFRKIWLLKPIYACPIHSIFLIDHCPQCKSPIDLKSGTILTCASCTYQLKDSPVIECSSIPYIQWFIDILNTGSNDIFKHFTAFWSALNKFSQLDMEDPLTIEKQLEITYEYFHDQRQSSLRFSAWINSRIHLAHPRIQLLPFLEHKRIFNNYIQLIESGCYQYYPTPKTQLIYLLPEEVRLVLDICRKTLKNWIRKDFLKLDKERYHYHSLPSPLIERFLLSYNYEHSDSIETLQTKTSDPQYLTLREVAKILETNYETARKLANTHWLKYQICPKNKVTKNISRFQVEKFHRHYITASTLAKKFDVNPTNLVEKLASIGITPISGPYIDSTPINIYARSFINNLKRSDIEAIKQYPTNSGRYNNSQKPPTNSKDFVSLTKVAEQLEISPNKVAILVQRGILTKDLTNPFLIMIEKKSLRNLKDKLESQDFILAKDAARQLNCAPNWLDKYWCKSGFLTIENLVYWKLVRKEHVYSILQIKETYITGAEANKLLGMHHSYITNLQAQGFINAYYMGKNDKKIRLFKREDVKKLKNLNLIES
ncbi:TniQ family protein [Acinetobacter baumannii]|uniref:TniQ family protein n=1 Tax=Acinetobacter baumannii TaxID=470 RepID=UPI000F9C4727|nr:TniQ family protein [Acinetobacter baumannii]RUT40294.1 transposase [Acinetobacter baumannii]